MINMWGVVGLAELGCHFLVDQSSSLIELITQTGHSCPSIPIKFICSNECICCPTNAMNSGIADTPMVHLKTLALENKVLCPQYLVRLHSISP